MKQGLSFFSRDAAPYQPLRQVGKGYQACSEWLGEGYPLRTGIAELAHIRIEDYVHPCDDFLFVLEGEVSISDANTTRTLRPGDAVFIPINTRITIEVPDKLVWIYAAVAPAGDWDSILNEPGALKEV